MQAIHYLAVAADSNTAAFAEFENLVHIWGLDPAEKRVTIPTVLQFGGPRLALSRDGARCFTAAYHSKGVACYDSRTGDLLWQRKDIKRTQELRISLSGDGLYCFLDRGATQLICTLTGETIIRIPGTRGITQSPFTPVDLVEKQTFELRTRDGTLIRRIDRLSSAVISIAFSPSWILISEMGRGLRCFHASTGEEAWFYKHAKSHHFLDLSFCASAGQFFGVSWLSHDEREKILFQIAPADIVVSPIISLGLPSRTVFTHFGTSLITTDGLAVNLKSGHVGHIWPSPNNSFKPSPLRGLGTSRFALGGPA